MPPSTQQIVESFIRERLIERQAEFLVSDDRRTTRQLTIDTARERGLTASWDEGDDRTYTLHTPDGEAIGSFRGYLCSANSSSAVKVGADKELTKQFLAAQDIPVPKGISFSARQFEAAVAYMDVAKHPMVFKPVTGDGGRGVSVNLRTGAQVRQAFEKIENPTRHRFLLEEYIPGLDVRCYVVDGKVIASASRIPAHLIGDGHRTVFELLRAANAQRKTHPHHRLFPIRPDWAALKRRRILKSDIPKKNEVVILNFVFNLHKGGYCIDVTDDLDVELQDLAVRAAAAIPGSPMVAVDLQVTSLTNPDRAVVLEVNHHGNFRIHHVPAYGTPRDVAGAIIDELLRQHRSTVESQRAPESTP